MRIYAKKSTLEMEIERKTYLQKLIRSKHNGMIKVVTGIRRCGKSYLLFNIFLEHLRELGIDESHIITVDLEDRHNKHLCDPDNLLAYIDSKIIDGDMHYVILDEVQRVKEFEEVLNSYLKKSNVDVYVTGSNSKLLSSDVITEFRGRGLEIRVHPLSFREFISAYQGESHEKALQEFMTYGGLPQIVSMQTAEEKEDYLKTLFAGTYLRDIKERYKIMGDSDLEELLDVIASGIGGLVNPRKLQDTFKTVKHSDISQDTIKRYLDIMQDAFLIERSIRYDIKGRKYINTPAKYYFNDLGLRNARLNFRQFEETHLMENMIYNELRIMGLSVDVGQVVINSKDKENTQSRRQNLEVDFVCNRGFKRYYIQSALDLPSPEKMEQEQRPLLHIKDNFQKMIIVGGITPTHINDNGIVIMNVYDFLLNDNLLSSRL